jgi:hypothetical protein
VSELQIRLWDDPPMVEIKARDLIFDNFKAERVASNFISTNHYSRICPPSKYYFTASHDGVVVGACCFRKPSLPSVQKAYNADLELARLVLIDEAGKNSESRFIGHCLRWIGKHTEHIRVVSYSDPAQGHLGVVYRASNFKYAGEECGHGTRVIIVDGERMHSKTAYDRYGASGSNLKELLPNSVVDVESQPKKLVYLYDLKQRGR